MTPDQYKKINEIKGTDQDDMYTDTMYDEKTYINEQDSAVQQLDRVQLLKVYFFYFNRSFKCESFLMNIFKMI